MNELIHELVADVQRGNKYRNIDPGFIEHIAILELPKGRPTRETVKAIRNKLHQVASAYQPKPIPYQELHQKLSNLPSDLHSPLVKTFCLETMQLHASTRERSFILEEFFSTTLASLKPLKSVLDLACGLNPLALPWMPVSERIRYLACDIFTDQLEFLNHFFEHFSINGQAFVCDLTQTVPQVDTECALILKTIPCLEQIDKNIGKRLLQNLTTPKLLVSFPVQSLSGKAKGMRAHYANHFYQIVEAESWSTTAFSFPNEVAYLVEK